MSLSPPLRRAMRVALWNAALCGVGLGVVAAAGEVWFRLRSPFHGTPKPMEFVPGAGVLIKRNSEVRWTNMRDFWTVSRTNSFGFLDREPPSPERARAGCHVAFVGDSFVEAREVPVADKFHVKLEEMAAQRLPGLDVVTSAWSRSATGQVAQMPYYDKWIRAARQGGAPSRPARQPPRTPATTVATPREEPTTSPPFTTTSQPSVRSWKSPATWNWP